ncbi:MAG: AMP-binding protein [Akkermansiaceae bacterium]
MDRTSFLSQSFWEDPKNCVVGGSLGDVPDLGTNGGAVIFKTSGSTGPPKWVVHEKRAILASAKAVNECLGVDQESKWGLALPVDHVGGFAILARVFQAGCRLAEMDEKWDAVKFHQWMEEERVTHVSLVPTQVHDLVAAKLRAPRSLRAVVVGGGRLLESLGQAARDLGWPVLASYGMTEAGSQIATQSMADLNIPFRHGNLNILPIWKVQCDTDDRLILSGEALFVGYLFQDDDSLRYEPICWKCFLTNDRAILSGNHLKLIGRMDSLVKLLGVLVDIEAVEQRFLEVGAGRVSAEKFAVIALPDPRKEHVLVAIFEGNVPNEIIEEYQEAAPSLERFDKIISVEKFPRSSLGKLRRGELGEMIGQGRLS